MARVARRLHDEAGQIKRGRQAPALDDVGQETRHPPLKIHENIHKNRLEKSAPL
jgi:hypothetical protein